MIGLYIERGVFGMLKNCVKIFLCQSEINHI